MSLFLVARHNVMMRMIADKGSWGGDGSYDTVGTVQRSGSALYMPAEWNFPLAAEWTEILTRGGGMQMIHEAEFYSPRQSVFQHFTIQSCWSCWQLLMAKYNFRPRLKDDASYDNEPGIKYITQLVWPPYMTFLNCLISSNSVFWERHMCSQFFFRTVDIILINSIQAGHVLHPIPYTVASMLHTVDLILCSLVINIIRWSTQQR